MNTQTARSSLNEDVVNSKALEQLRATIVSTKLTREQLQGMSQSSPTQARFLVDSYYTMQANRIRTNNQIRAMLESGEPHDVLLHLAANFEGMESQMKSALNWYVKGHPMGSWLKGVKGIGPVIAAGMISAIDIEKAPTVGHIWSYAGLNPSAKWEKGELRPWNADLKRLCWLLGESFTKVSGRDGAIYGQMYIERKEYETAKNENRDYANQAEASLKQKSYGKSTEAYKMYIDGKLPLARIHLRAQRYAVKMFLAHLHQVWYETYFKRPAPLPYAITQLGHAHYIAPPNYDPLPRPLDEKKFAENVGKQEPSDEKPLGDNSKVTPTESAEHNDESWED